VAQGQVIGTVGATEPPRGRTSTLVKSGPLSTAHHPAARRDQAAVQPASPRARRLDGWLGILAPGEGRPGPEIERLAAAK
jgi:hypothetical protein